MNTVCIRKLVDCFRPSIHATTNKLLTGELPSVQVNKVQAQLDYERAHDTAAAIVTKEAELAADKDKLTNVQQQDAKIHAACKAADEQLKELQEQYDGLKPQVQQASICQCPCLIHTQSMTHGRDFGLWF